jgi:glycosyltransferase involved in cell wall biosynthesis
LVAERFPIDWHGSARHIREAIPGLTPARLRGIAEASGELLVFVDDDNVLEPDFLQKARTLADSFPQLGAFGAGSIRAEFETSPSEEVLKYTGMLALRETDRAHWSNTIAFSPSIPYGAGLCVRRNVALAYAKCIAQDALRGQLDRGSTDLLSCGDVDLALMACQEGMGTGVFPELVVTHLIPSCRLENEYLVRLAEGHALSHGMLGRIWGYGQTLKEHWLMGRLRHWRRLLSLRGLSRQIYLAERRGRLRAAKLLTSHTNP